MQNARLSTEDINSFIETQLETWPLAADNFKKLQEVRRKPVSLGDLDIFVQYNPARIVSTGAKVDKDTIASRRCFLCKSNRPDEQIAVPVTDTWELLLNPFPILPVHFTIANRDHIPQARIPLDMVTMADKAPGLAFFYNGARAGASAPDHLHAQAVLASELPLIRIAEKFHKRDNRGFVSSDTFGIDLPFVFISAVIYPDAEGMNELSKIGNAFGIDNVTLQPDHGLVNSFFWIDREGLLRIIIIPRRKHRPNCYDVSDDTKLLISPGALDMAGIIVCPRLNDYERVGRKEISDIYSEVAFSKYLPDAITQYFGL